MTVFVFGSNLAGRHGAGSAREAFKYYGAQYGVAEGPTGRSYAIPTRDKKLQTLTLLEVTRSVKTFLNYAEKHPDCLFRVVKIGCGLAGFQESEIAPLFAQAPSNCQLPPGWR